MHYDTWNAAVCIADAIDMGCNCAANASNVNVNDISQRDTAEPHKSRDIGTLKAQRDPPHLFGRVLALDRN